MSNKSKTQLEKMQAIVSGLDQIIGLLGCEWKHITNKKCKMRLMGISNIAWDTYYKMVEVIENMDEVGLYD